MIDLILKGAMLSLAEGPNLRELKQWIAANMPELNRELGPLPMGRVRDRLNEITGCNVQEGSMIEEGAAKFLAALKKANNFPV